MGWQDAGHVWPYGKVGTATWEGHLEGNGSMYLVEAPEEWVAENVAPAAARPKAGVIEGATYRNVAPKLQGTVGGVSVSTSDEGRVSMSGSPGDGGELVAQITGAVEGLTYTLSADGPEAPGVELFVRGSDDGGATGADLCTLSSPEGEDAHATFTASGSQAYYLGLRVEGGGAIGTSFDVCMVEGEVPVTGLRVDQTKSLEVWFRSPMYGERKTFVLPEGAMVLFGDGLIGSAQGGPRAIEVLDAGAAEFDGRYRFDGDITCSMPAHVLLEYDAAYGGSPIASMASGILKGAGGFSARGIPDSDEAGAYPNLWLGGSVPPPADDGGANGAWGLYARLGAYDNLLVAPSGHEATRAVGGVLEGSPVAGVQVTGNTVRGHRPRIQAVERDDLSIREDGTSDTLGRLRIGAKSAGAAQAVELTWTIYSLEPGASYRAFTDVAISESQDQACFAVRVGDQTYRFGYQGALDVSFTVPQEFDAFAEMVFECAAGWYPAQHTDEGAEDGYVHFCVPAVCVNESGDHDATPPGFADVEDPEVYIAGGNLWFTPESTPEQGQTSGISLRQNADGSMQVESTGPAQAYVMFEAVAGALEAGETYNLSIDSPVFDDDGDHGFAVILRDSAGAANGHVYRPKTSGTRFTVPDDFAYAQYRFDCLEGDEPNGTFRVVLTRGRSKGVWSRPASKLSAKCSLRSLPGGARDLLTFSALGRATVERRVLSKTFDGSSDEAWEVMPSNDEWCMCPVDGTYVGGESYDIQTQDCDVFGHAEGFGVSMDGDQLYARINTAALEGVTDVPTLRTFLQGTPVTARWEPVAYETEDLGTFDVPSAPGGEVSFWASSGAVEARCAGYFWTTAGKVGAQVHSAAVAEVGALRAGLEAQAAQVAELEEKVGSLATDVQAVKAKLEGTVQAYMEGGVPESGQCLVVRKAGDVWGIDYEDGVDDEA